MVEVIPDKNTDAWAVWVTQQLQANGETALSDEDIAAIVNRPDSRTRARLNQLIATADEGVAAALKQYTADTVQAFRDNITREISSGDVNAVSTSKTYTDLKATDTLDSAKRYADTIGASAGVPQSYVDDKVAGVTTAYKGGDTATLNSARSYTDERVTAGVKTATDYTDNRVTGLVSRGTLDGDLQATSRAANQYADGVGTATLAAAKKYADDNDSGTDTAYVDQKVGTATTDLQAYARAQDAALKSTVDSERDDAIEASVSGVAAMIDSKLSDNVAYTDTGDAETLQAARDYTDVAIATGGGAGGGGTVTTGYVDTGDANTLSSAKTYADSGDSTVYQNARTYADAKYTKPSTGIPRNDLDTSTKTSLNRADSALQPGTAFKAIAVDTTKYDTNGFGYRINAGNIELLGTLTNKAGNMTTSVNTDIATNIPAEMRPSITVRLPISFYGVVFGMLQITPGGTMTISTGTTTGNALYFGGLAYPTA